MTPCIILADDHSMIRKGIRLLITSRLGYKNVYEADSCNSLMNELKNVPCTHMILDVIFPDGTCLEIVPIIRKLYPDVKIMIFSMQPVDIYADAFRQYDIYYYLPKSSNEEEISTCIKSFLNNETYHNKNKSTAIRNNPFSSLAPRELEILHYLLNGYKTNDIAATLNLSNSTVSTFKKRIFDKTGTTSLSQLFEIASVNNLGFFAGTAKTKND